MDFFVQIIQYLSTESSIGSFWGPLAVGIILFIPTYLLSRNSNNNKLERVVTIRIVKEEYQKHLIEIKHPPSPQPSRPSGTSQPSKNDQLPVAISAGLLLLSIFYAKYQTQIILAILGVATFLLTHLLFTVVFAIRNKVTYGEDWKRYFVATFGLVACAFPLMYLALHPMYSPGPVENMSYSVNSGGVTALFKNHGIIGFGFLLFQALGFLSLATALLLQFLSLTFYTSILQIVTSNRNQPILELLAKATKRFSRPYITIASSIFLYSISALLISGVAYAWWYQGR